MTSRRTVLITLTVVAFGVPAVPASASAPPSWVAVTDSRNGVYDDARAVAVNPVSGSVVVAGYSSRAREQGRYLNFDYATATYAPTTGQLRGVRLEASPGDPDPGVSNNDFGIDLAIEPETGRTYVTGDSDGFRANNPDITTVGYSASGGRLWTARYDGSAGGAQSAAAVAVDPGTGNVYVTGTDFEGPDWDIVTVAYDASGTQLWVDEYDGPDGRSDSGADVTVGPDGTVYVTGSRNEDADPFGEDRIVTLAYRPDGTRVWVTAYDGPAGQARPSEIAVDPVTGTVYVAGFVGGRAGNAGDSVLLAYSPAGVQAWVSTHDDPDDNTAVPVGLALVPGGTIYVTGTLDAPTGSERRFLTLGYRPDGTQVFADALQLPGQLQSEPADVAVDAATGIAYVTGSARSAAQYNVATIAYSPTGRRLRLDTYDSGRSDRARALVVDTARGQLYVAGYTQGSDPDGDILVLAYPTVG